MSGILPHQALPECLTYILPERILSEFPITATDVGDHLPLVLTSDDCTGRVCALLSLASTSDKYEILWDRLVNTDNNPRPAKSTFIARMAQKAIHFRESNGLFPKDAFSGTRTYDSIVNFVGANYGDDNLFFGITGRVIWPRFVQETMPDLSPEAGNLVLQAGYVAPPRVYYPLPVPQDVPARLRAALQQKGVQLRSFKDWLLFRDQAFQHFYPETRQAYINAQQHRVTWSANEWTTRLSNEITRMAEPPSTWLPVALRGHAAPAEDEDPAVLNTYHHIKTKLDTGVSRADLERIYMCSIPEEWFTGPTRKLNSERTYTVFERLGRPFVNVKDHKPLQDLGYRLRRMSPNGGAVTCVLSGVKLTFLWWTNRLGGYLEGRSDPALQDLKIIEHKSEIEYAMNLSEDGALNWVWTNEAEFVFTHEKTDEPDSVKVLRLLGDGHAFDRWV